MDAALIWRQFFFIQKKKSFENPSLEKYSEWKWGEYVNIRICQKFWLKTKSDKWIMFGTRLKYF